SPNSPPTIHFHIFPGAGRGDGPPGSTVVAGGASRTLRAARLLMKVRCSAGSAPGDERLGEPPRRSQRGFPRTPVGLLSAVGPDETFDDAHVVSFSCSGAGLLSSRPEPDERHTPLLLAFGHRRVGGVHGSGNAGRPGSERSPRRP